MNSIGQTLPVECGEALRRADASYRAEFGVEPEALGVAPGRVNIVGEHTDYTGGLALPMAIAQSCVVAIGRETRDRTSRVVAADLGERLSLPAEQALDPSVLSRLHQRWARYALGPIALAHEHVSSRSGGLGAGGASGARAGTMLALRMSIASDVPRGGGVSSSAALEVASLMAFARLSGAELAPREVVSLAQRTENEIVGVPCGVLDQFASVMARAGSAMLLDCADATCGYTPMPGPEHAAILVINSGKPHELHTGEYARRRAACAAAVLSLGIASLREVDLGMLEYKEPELTDEEFRYAKHVVMENRRVAMASELLADMTTLAPELVHSRLQRLGGILNASHESLRTLSRVSCAELDTIVELCRRVEGVYGARMSGAGFGGSVIALMMPGAVEGVVSLVRAEYPRRHNLVPTFFVARAGPGASAWSSPVRVADATIGPAQRTE
jgi:galactokinase